jgi:nucleotide-binding universal stress UspA family protein
MDSIVVATDGSDEALGAMQTATGLAARRHAPCPVLVLRSRQLAARQDGEAQEEVRAKELT